MVFISSMRGRDLGAGELDQRVLRGLVAVHAVDARLAVFEVGVEHALQRADRAGRDAAEEHLAERQPVERRRVDREARARRRGNCRRISACGSPARTRP